MWIYYRLSKEDNFTPGTILHKDLMADLIVPSPTSILLQIYKTGPFNIYHYDLYRLKAADEIYELSIEEAFDNNICLIEWSEIITHLLPESTININICAKK